VLRLRRHRLPEGRPAGPAGTQDLPAAVQAVSRQRPSKVGLEDLAHALFVGGGWTQPQSTGNCMRASAEARGSIDRLQPLSELRVRLVRQHRRSIVRLAADIEAQPRSRGHSTDSVDDDEGRCSEASAFALDRDGY
jgi:hypothetical protein